MYADLIELDLLLNSEGAALFDASLDYLVGLDTKKSRPLAVVDCSRVKTLN